MRVKLTDATITADTDLSRIISDMEFVDATTGNDISTITVADGVTLTLMDGQLSSLTFEVEGTGTVTRLSPAMEAAVEPGAVVDAQGDSLLAMDATSDREADQTGGDHIQMPLATSINNPSITDDLTAGTDPGPSSSTPPDGDEAGVTAVASFIKALTGEPGLIVADTDWLHATATDPTEAPVALHASSPEGQQVLLAMTLGPSDQSVHSAASDGPIAPAGGESEVPSTGWLQPLLDSPAGGPGQADPGGVAAVVETTAGAVNDPWPLPLWMEPQQTVMHA